MINLQALIDDAKCYDTIRALHWPDGVRMSRVWPRRGDLRFFEFVHDDRSRGKALLASLIQLLVAPRNPG